MESELQKATMIILLLCLLCGDVLLSSVGGVGLNITGANVVIIFDPDWNPAVDSQAQDRYSLA